ncbi:DNA-binding protein [Noviherbaspirillum galbum]|uniref:KfrA N-terminal DNA-binding domain-containing protein n=1 Tax=Noviherbaspirillum galbum TaxID=2709383 RepID=A0A6B3SZY1_9BURK|nr:DNA-binding protein [Noviherbaspirillum galbum]NEX64909.1 hypothetical protein [Noviherbaspirillum galbum]
MARAGISYTDVARAASQLVADGRSPTVDSVREALGSTGSKSTISPYLKRWKEEHQGEIAAAESGLPATLIEAVKGLHQHMQADFTLQAEALREKHVVALQEAAATERQLRAERDAIRTAHTALEEECARLRTVLLDLQQQYQNQTTTLAATRAEKDGLQHRLADRAAEVGTLEQQLNQTRAQFEYFQEATAAQRMTDRQAFEQRISRLEHELTAAQQRTASQQVLQARQEAQLGQLESRLEQAKEESKANLDQAISLRTERDRLAERLEASAVARDDALSQATMLGAQVTEARVTAAGFEREATLLAETARMAEQKVAELTQEKLEWMQERTALMQRLEANGDAAKAAS